MAFKYLEQTTWLLNPQPDKRKNRRWAKQSWIKGTRWVFDEDAGRLTGDGMSVDGPLAAKIVAHCKEVEPGFGGIVDQFNFRQIIAWLIDNGRITVADIQDALKPEEQEDEDESGDVESWERHSLDTEMYNYRHWLSLYPPCDTLMQIVAEQEWRESILNDYEQRQHGVADAAAETGTDDQH